VTYDSYWVVIALPELDPAFNDKQIPAEIGMRRLLPVDPAMAGSGYLLFFSRIE
jgi:hypothetical protein